MPEAGILIKLVMLNVYIALVRSNCVYLDPIRLPK